MLECCRLNVACDIVNFRFSLLKIIMRQTLSNLHLYSVEEHQKSGAICGIKLFVTYNKMSKLVLIILLSSFDECLG